MGFYEEKLLKDFMNREARSYKIPIRYLQEKGRLGTGGGLFKFEKEILDDDSDDVFVLHSDVACSFPLDQLLKYHKKQGKIATLMVTQVDKKFAQQYGCVVVDKDHLLTHYAFKPSAFISNTINTGVYCFSRKLWSSQIRNLVMKKKGQDAEERNIEDQVEERRRGLLNSMEAWEIAGLSIYCYIYSLLLFFKK